MGSQYMLSVIHDIWNGDLDVLFEIAKVSMEELRIVM